MTETTSSTCVLDPTPASAAGEQRRAATAANDPSRCRHRYPNGGRCRMPSSPGKSGLCLRHVQATAPAALSLVVSPSDSEDLSAELLPELKELAEFDAAFTINQFLARLLILVTRAASVRAVPPFFPTSPINCSTPNTPFNARKSGNRNVHGLSTSPVGPAAITRNPPIPPLRHIRTPTPTASPCRSPDNMKNPPESTAFLCRIGRRNGVYSWRFAQDRCKTQIRWPPNGRESKELRSMNKKFVLLTVTAGLVIAAIFVAGTFSRAAAPAPGPSGYHVVKSFPVAGEGGWDYVTVDSAARRLYVSHSTHVVVFDTDTYAVVGDIPDTQGVHGIALAPDLGRGFVSNGRANTATIFDLKTLKTIGTVATGTNPDAILYEPVTKRVFTFNGRSNDATAINAADGTVLGTIPLGGKPEFAQADGKGTIYVNIEDTSELLHLDAQKLSVMHRWPLAPCKEPSGLAMDVTNRRLFAGCDNEMMAVVDADSGKVIATPPIGAGVDANGFDPETNLAFSSNGQAGTLTVVHEDTPNTFTVLEHVPTKKSARTMGLDLKTHNIFLPAADFDPPAPGERRGKMKPGSFVIVVVSK